MILIPLMLFVSGKTSILFNFAYNEASIGKNVVFITKQRNNVPLHPENSPYNDDILSKIEIRYFQHSNDLRAYCAGIHMLENLPDTIVVDDVSSFISNNIESYRLKNMAFLVDAVDYISNAKYMCETTGTILNEKKDCTLIVSESLQQEATPKLIDTFNRWTPIILLIQGQSAPYTLMVHSVHNQRDPLNNRFEFNFDGGHFNVLSETVS
eukprot:TRINITY_DN1492_c0_g1_i1.p1 TRINITY_DN1492_c0_g1~~TRINITY_DN1492_c0_g1_i1.p1  ORF type:complete len:210 (+),score=39.02 TRINITY_DN1492_c0_g1_i1:283-912(+)